jgi:catechol-2,3-dioxygenase
LAHGAFACRDREGLDDIRERAQTEGLEPAPFSTPLFAQDAFAVTDPDGNAIVFGLAANGEGSGPGMKGPIQHLTLATHDVSAIEDFYAGKLGFAVSDRVRNKAGEVTTCFMRSNHEHHTLACFRSNRQGIDHHSYEAGDWNTIRDWADRFGEREIPLMWGPGRHGPGNNLFIFIEDPDGNWIEVSAELEVIHDRPVKEWPHSERTLNLWGRAIMRS